MAKILIKCNDSVRVTCGGKTKTWERSDAIDFFREGMLWSEGSERDSYCNIVGQLLAGAKVVTDDIE